MKKDDWCLVQWADETDPHTAKTVVDAFEVEIREDQAVTGFNRGQSEDSSIDTGRHNRVTKITVDGTNYDYNTNAWYKHNTLNDFDANELVNKTYTVYMDQFGYFIGVELYSGDNQYVFITGYDRTQSNITVSTSKAAAIFTDGTMQAIDVNVKDTDENIRDWLSDHRGDPLAKGYDLWSSHIVSNGEHQENMWYKYTENKGVYTLTPVDGYTRDINDDPADRTVNCSNIYLTHNITNDYGTGRSYGEDESIYIVVDEDAVDPGKGITEVTGLYTGVQNVNLVIPNNKWIHAVWEDNYIVAAIVFGDAEGIVDNYAFIRSGVNREWTETDSNGNVTHFWEFDAVMDGVKTTKTIKSRFATTTRQLKPGTVQELVLDSDGYVTKIKDLENTPNTPAATHVSGNEVYDNVDFNSSSVLSLKDYDAYHIMTRLTNRNYSKLYGNVSTSDTLTGLNPGTTHIDLAFQNNTLRYTTANNDIGLPVTKDAKAVVWQSINGEGTWTDYSSVAGAYAMLNDADSDSANNVNGVKQFDGEVIAALNSNGVAEWVVFIDYTPTQGKNPSYPENTDRGDEVTLPTWTDLGVEDTKIGGSTDNLDINGRYHKDAGKLYLQFSGSAVPTDASKITLKNVNITERSFSLYGAGSVLRSVTTDITVRVQKGSTTSYVAVLDFASANKNDLLPSTIYVDVPSVYAQTPNTAGNGLEIDEWYVSYTGAGAPVAADRQETVSNQANAAITFTVGLPAGYQNVTYTGTGSTNVMLPTFANITGRTTYTAKVAAAGVTRPVINLVVDTTVLNIQEESELGSESRKDYTDAYAAAGTGVTTDPATKTSTISGLDGAKIATMLNSGVGKEQLKLMEGTESPGYLWIGITYKSPKVNDAYATGFSYVDKKLDGTQMGTKTGTPNADGIVPTWLNLTTTGGLTKDASGNITAVTGLAGESKFIRTMTWTFANGQTIKEEYHVIREAGTRATP